MQTVCFLYYVYGVWGDKNDIGVQSNLPVAGPEVWWMKVIGNFEDGCHDLRYQAWRLWSYQLVYVTHFFGTVLVFMA